MSITNYKFCIKNSNSTIYEKYRLHLLQQNENGDGLFI